MHRPTLLVLATALTLAACSSDKPKTDAASASDQPAASNSASSTSGDQDLADITNYKLTMDKVNKWYDAQRNMAMKVKDMSPAERAALDSTEGTDAANGSLDDIARNIEKHPQMRDAVRAAGLSPREYATLTMSLVQSGMAAGVLKMRPKDNQDSLVREMKANRDNVRFMQEHEAELNQKQQAMQAEMQKMGVGDSGKGSE